MFAGVGNPLGTSVLLIPPLLGVREGFSPKIFLGEAENLPVGLPFDFTCGGLCCDIAQAAPRVAACVQTHA